MAVVLAYLDAGTGSMILGAAAAGGAAVVVAAKTSWHRLTKRKGSSEATVEPVPATDADAAVETPAVEN